MGQRWSLHGSNHSNEDEEVGKKRFQTCAEGRSDFWIFTWNTHTYHSRVSVRLCQEYRRTRFDKPRATKYHTRPKHPYRNALFPLLSPTTGVGRTPVSDRESTVESQLRVTGVEVQVTYRLQVPHHRRVSDPRRVLSVVQQRPLLVSIREPKRRLPRGKGDLPSTVQ